ncbi:MAG TPA: LuxR C-terminal-related transcriptional regulator [Nitrospiraceae bacterium]|jgi:DNA-binding NarL/FixJ family response regulator|nr:LuxR C-terminal-related transcriptional regulator [Nitrospiraceae bacterium]
MPKVKVSPRSRPRKATLELVPPRRKRPEALTSREQEILELIWSGFKNKEIAQRLKISVKTVEAHRANMMKKVRVSNTAQLLKAAIQGGMIKIR